MKKYGTIEYSTVNAPQPIAGICEGFTYRKSDQIFEIMGESDLEGVVLHGSKGEITFSSTPAGTVTALGVRAGAELTISGVTGGKILVTQSTARWQRGQPMVMEASATHYPDLTATASGTITPGTITLAEGTGPLVIPTDKVWFGTAGLAYSGGIVQSCSITESVQVQEEEDGAGKIAAVILYGYKAEVQMEVLTNAALPELGSTLDAFASFRLTQAEERWAKGSTRSISLQGLLIPGVV